jgi:amino acid adenylation domain-containing protein
MSKARLQQMELTDSTADADEQEVFVFPASFAQQRLWLIHQLEPDDPSYNVATVLRLEGQLNVGALQQALDEVVRRHEVLRTTFAIVNDGPAQIIHPDLRIPIDVVDLGDFPAAERWNEAMRRVTEQAWQPFDLEAGPLLRALLLRLEEDDHLSILTMHHIISDAWSKSVLVEEISALYDAYLHDQPSPLEELAIQYADFAEWQQQWLTGEVLENQLAYWREQLDGAPSVLNLPTDRPRPAIQSHRGATQAINLAPAVAQALKELSRQENATLFMTLLAGFKALLYHYTGQTDIVVGTPVAGRNQAETEKLIGFFVNTLPLRTDVSDEPSFRELVGRVQEVALGAFAHQELPFEKLVEELNPERSLSYTPLFQVVFAFQSVNTSPHALPGLRLTTPYIENTTAKFDLTFLATEREAGINCSLEYNTDLFDVATITRMLDHLRNLFEAAVANPSQRVGDLPLLSAAEQHQLLAEWNSTATEYPRHRCVHELFEEQAVQSAEAMALVFEKETLTYRQLNERANQLAHRLRALGVGPEVTVGVLMDRSPELIIALLGILKTGGVYVPLNPAYPKERLALMCDDAQLRVLITQETFAGSLSDGSAELLCVDAADLSGESTSNLDNHTTPENRAYVMYTSGSTGRPKGVNVEHRSIVRLVKNTNYADFSSAQTFLQFAPTTFDASTLEIWGTLLNGGRLVIMPPGAASPEELGNVLQRHNVTTLWLTAGLFHLMVDENLEGLRSVKQLIAGGDVLSPAHIAKVLREFPDCRVINGYGPTENTTFTCCHSMQAGDELGATVPIGRPISNTRVYLVNQRFQLVPAGVPGELLAAGDGLARDYLGDPVLTAQKFIPDPFSAQPGGRLYRTGDLARYLPDGTIEFLGRADQQVKIRGFRIEPEEIEFVLERHPNVRRAVVQVNSDADGEKQLVAYVAINSEPGVGDDELREYLAEKLPDYMMPSAFVLMDELPLTTNGKVDRSRLPELGEWNANRQEYVAPSTPIEELVCNVFADVLRLQKVGASENFFQLGGHSLSATRVVSRVREAIGPIVSLRDLFEASTPALLARRIERAQKAGGATEVLPMRARERTGPVPLSFAQQRLWFFDQLEPNSASYNIPIALRISGRLNVAALESSLADVVRRHEALRTSFSLVEGVPVQVVRDIQGWQLPLIELTTMREPEREAEIFMKREAMRPFDLQAGPLFRATLLHLAGDDHVLLLTMHHIVSDGWSMGVLVREAATLYQAYIEGREAALPEVVVQYADFACWQREWLTGEVLEEQLSYWRQQLGGAPAELELPVDRSRPKTPSYRGTMETLALSEELTESLQAFSRSESATLFMTLVAGFKALLYRYMGQTDIVVGTPVAGRNRAEIENLIGFFINTLPLRTDVSGDPTFRELLKRVRDVALGAYAHQDLPFERLVEELQPERHLGRAPLIRVMLVLQNTPLESLALPDLSFTMVSATKSMSEFDWVINAQETERGLFLTFEYNTDLFEATTIRRLLEQFNLLLAGAVAQPEQRISDLPLLTKLEKSQLLIEWDRSAIAPVGRSVHGLFEQQVTRDPHAPAVSFSGEQITYIELDERSNQIAHGLLESGIRRGQPVAIMLDSSLLQIAALLGVLKAGCHFVCLDARYPAARLQQMLNEVGPPCLIVGTSQLASHAELLTTYRGDTIVLNEQSFENCPRTAPEIEVRPDDLVYIVYTSGSTGRPKGIMQTHAGLCQFVEWKGRQFGIAPGKRIAQWASITYDAAYDEIFGALCCGATLCMTGALVRSEPQALTAWLRDEQISLLITVPSFARQILQILQTDQRELHMEALLLAGEALPVCLADAWLKQFPQGPQLYNLYGPTESVLATYHHVTESDLARRSIPVGRAIDGRHILIIDQHGKLSPIGGTGEIYLRSPYLSRGYVAQPEQTAEAFVQNPLQDEHRELVYRTSDLGRWTSDGSIELLGRKDNQVKIRGMRVELDEIEAALLRHEEVLECVVAAHDFDQTDRRLCAYVVAQGTPAAYTLRSFLKNLLPDYMVPGSFIFLPDLPRLPNGKVDRHALPAPDAQRPEMELPYAEPETETELTVASIWKELLRAERVSRHDNFFDLGGHSLLATQVVLRLREALRVEVSLRMLFESPTVAELAAVVEEAQKTGAGLILLPPIEAADRTDELPLSFAEERLWFLHQLEPQSSAYNLFYGIRLHGSLNVSALEQTLQEIVRRHEILRTTFARVAGRPIRRIAASSSVSLAVTDLSAFEKDERLAEAERIAHEAAHTPFDLVAGPLLRPELLQLSEDEHVLLFTLHHIISDGWSATVLVREVAALYEAFCARRASPLPDLPIQYADYAVWQRHWLQAEVLESHLSYWRQTLQGAPPLLDLPTDRPRPIVQTFNGDAIPFAVSKDLSEALGALSRRKGATLYMTLLAAFQLLMSRYTGRTDIVVGGDTANRTRVETEDLIGFFVNMLVLRTSVDGDLTFNELLRRVREVALSAYAHQELPFEKLVEELQVKRELSHNPLFQVMFTLQNNTPNLELSSLQLEAMSVRGRPAKFDLTLGLKETAGGLIGFFEYNTDLFNKATIERLAGHFETLLQSIVAAPEQRVSVLPILGDAERHLLDEWSLGQSVDLPVECAPELFEAQVSQTPKAVAVVDENTSLSYDELNRRANQLAHLLRSWGVGPDVLVAICIDRSVEMVIAILGVLKAGGAYLPLAPDDPLERLSVMLEETNAPVVLTSSILAEKLPAQFAQVLCLNTDWELVTPESDSNLARVAVAENLAYVIYTSGSTGKPKGVMVTHRGLVNYLSWCSDAYHVVDGCGSLVHSPLTFDLTVTSLLSPLCVGRSVTLVRDDPGSAGFADALRHLGNYSLVKITPAHLTLVAYAISDRAAIELPRLLVVGGEALTCDALTFWQQHSPGTKIVNEYGPTETVVGCCVYEVTAAEAADGEGRVPIGRPIANTHLRVLDADLQPVPIGISGELYIGGFGVARGYVNAPDLTAERFVPDPFSATPGGRLYRTGDLVRYLADGNLDFIGRQDSQVKLFGYRIELGEIESVLASHHTVREAIAILREDFPGKKQLVAYITAVAPSLEIGELRRHVSERLPEYMVPSCFVLLDALPHTSNGKIDRQALPAPVEEHDTELLIGPRTPVEEVLCGIWIELLGVEQIGVYENFFDAGGHSLMAVQLLSRLRAIFQLELPLQLVFEAPTIAELAQALIKYEGKPGQVEKIAAITAQLESMSPEAVSEMLHQSMNTASS